MTISINEAADLTTDQIKTVDFYGRSYFVTADGKARLDSLGDRPSDRDVRRILIAEHEAIAKAEGR